MHLPKDELHTGCWSSVLIGCIGSASAASSPSDCLDASADGEETSAAVVDDTEWESRTDNVTGTSVWGVFCSTVM